MLFTRSSRPPFALCPPVTGPTLRVARRRLRDALIVQGLDPDDACLVLSELATNALLHGGETAAVAWALCGERLLLTVADTSPPSVEPAPPDGERDGGRGLLLVDLLTESWGIHSVGDSGKEVWCEIALKAAA